MKYLFDTDAISFFFDETRHPQYSKIRNKVSQLEDDDILEVSVLTLYELEYSFENAPEEKKTAIREVIQELEQAGTFQIIPLLNKSASTFGKLKTAVKSHKSVTSKQMRKHNIDLMLASTAICESAILVSADKNYKVLVQINSDLQVQDWTV